MRLFHLFATTFCLSWALFSCQSESVQPKGTEGPEVQNSNEGLQRPGSQCGSSTFTNFVDGSNNVLGSIEVLNTESQLYVLVDMNSGWLLQGAKIFAGNSLDIPKTGNGNIQLEEFPHQFMHSRAQDKSTFRVPTASLPACFSVLVQGQAVQLSMFGNITNSRQVWASGTTVLNGQVFNYCNGVCQMLNNSSPANN